MKTTEQNIKEITEKEKRKKGNKLTRKIKQIRKDRNKRTNKMKRNTKVFEYVTQGAVFRGSQCRSLLEV